MLTEIFSQHWNTLPGLVFTWVSLHELMVLLGLTIYAIASHTRRQKRHPSAAIAWVISLVLLPYIALPLYLMIGSRKLEAYRRSAKPDVLAFAAAGGGKLAAGQLEAAIGLPQAASFEALVIHQDGRQALQRLHAMIDSATRSLDVCSFLLGRDAAGDQIATRLMQRAREGIQVRLMIDGIGIYLGGRPNLKRLSAAGVQVALFVSPLRSALRGRTNLRNHRKMVLIDGQWLWCGGRNLAAEYFEGDPAASVKKPPWIDLSFDLVGVLAAQAQERFDHDWRFALTGKPAKVVVHAHNTPEGGSGGALNTARLVPSGPDQADDTIYTLLVSGCFNARQRILMVTPYFVPDATLLMALTLAARRGITVDVLLPLRSNHHLADIARFAALRELDAAGARVWLAPGMLHAKAVLIDDGFALVGSANLDERSLFLNYELMVAFYDAPVVQDFARWIEQQRSSTARYSSRPPGLAREFIEGMVRWVAFQL